MNPRTIRLGTSLVTTLVAMLGFIFLFAGKAPAQSARLRVMSSDGMKPAVQALLPQIEHAIGHKLAPQFDASKTLRDKILIGAPFDVAILTTDIIDELVKQGKIAPGTSTEIARTGMGIGIREGAPKPDISTAESLKRTLQKAKSISFNPSGASAVHINAMFTRLGIAQEMKPKLILDPVAGAPQKNVVAGKAELVITLIPEIRFFPGLELVGPLPGDLQSYISFSAGVAANSQNMGSAMSLIKFIISPAAAPTLKSREVEPH